MSRKLSLQMLISGIVFCVASMWVMLFFAKHKAINIENIAQDQVQEQVKNEESLNIIQDSGTQDANGTLRFRQGEENTDYLCIPLESSVKAENVTIENHYMDRQMWIYISNISPKYFSSEAVYGNISNITAGVYEEMEEGVLLKFSMSSVFECKTIFEENHLYVQFQPPREIYNQIIVIDANGGGEISGICQNNLIEKDITLDIVKKLKKRLDGESIKVYYTRVDDTQISDIDKINLANTVHADLFISIRLNCSDDSSVYGTESFYNENYFIPGFGSVDLANIVEKNVVTEISGKGNGLFPANNTDVILQDAKIPATSIAVGYASNKQEAILLNREDYRSKVAEGLYKAIIEAYE